MVHTLLMAYDDGLSSLSTVLRNCTDGMLECGGVGGDVDVDVDVQWKGQVKLVVAGG